KARRAGRAARAACRDVRRPAASRALSSDGRAAAAARHAAASQARAAGDQESLPGRAATDLRRPETVRAEAAWREGAHGGAARSALSADAEAGTSARSREKARRVESAGSGGDARARHGARQKRTSHSDWTVAVRSGLRAAVLDSVPAVGEDVRQPRSLAARRHLAWRRGIVVSRPEVQFR